MQHYISILKEGVLLTDILKDYFKHSLSQLKLNHQIKF